MSVLIVTSLGDIVVDLHPDLCPLTCKNFLKLCKIKYYNGCLFHTVQKDFTAQTGDPTGTGTGGDSIYKFLYGDQARFFGDEIRLDLKHSKIGTVAMASAGKDLNASQFYITLRDDLNYLDEKHTVFGVVAEGIETLNRINEAYVDDKGKPYKNIRIKHTYILEDPFEDPPQLSELIPDASPEGKPKDEVDDVGGLEDDWKPMDEQLAPGELEEVIRSKEAHSRAVVLESIGDIPDAEIKPPDNVLFVCKLNPVTEDEDLHTIFSRFGTVTSAEIIRDYKTGDSLCYAFIEFENKDSCEQAYFKMDNALIDDRRIHVDFSQSVSKLWSQYKRKDNQAGKGRGCFKCGSLDHMAKDCTGSPTDKQQSAKYILKDDNTQRGGAVNNSGYEMVFDGDETGSPQRNKRRKGHEVEDDDYFEKQKLKKHQKNSSIDEEVKEQRYDYKKRDVHESSGRENKHGDRSVKESYTRNADAEGSRRDYYRRNERSRGNERGSTRTAENDERSGGYRRKDERGDYNRNYTKRSGDREGEKRGDNEKRSSDQKDSAENDEHDGGYRRKDDRGDYSRNYTKRSGDREGEKRGDDEKRSGDQKDSAENDERDGGYRRKDERGDYSRNYTKRSGDREGEKRGDDEKRSGDQKDNAADDDRRKGRSRHDYSYDESRKKHIESDDGRKNSREHSKERIYYEKSTKSDGRDRDRDRDRKAMKR